MDQGKKIGILTGGGDAPGMNACIRSCVRNAISHHLEPVGIVGGYKGILNKNFEPLDLRSVANKIQRGGTFLKSARLTEFHNASIRAQGIKNLESEGIGSLIVIGGDGSLKGAHALAQESRLSIVGIPGTIDNDVFGSDISLGFDTAINTAVEAIDRIRDTAASHDRLFIVEVMGKDSGFLATQVGLAAGAEAVLVPESPFSLDQLATKIQMGEKKGKQSSIIVAAEGKKPGRSYDLAESLRKKLRISARVCILGHIQRGGAPSARDRILAAVWGQKAVEAIVQSQSDILVGYQRSQFTSIALREVTSKTKSFGNQLLRLVETLAQ